MKEKKSDCTRIDPWGLLSALVFLVAVFTATGFLSKFWWFFDVTSSFRFVFAELGLLSAIVFALGRKKYQVFFATGVLVVNAAVILPQFLAGGKVPKTAQCRLVLANVKSDNTDYDRVLKLVQKELPDMVILQEINTSWVSALNSLRAEYPYYTEYPESDNFGIGLYSKYPLESLEVTFIGEINVASIHATYRENGNLWNIIATHPLPPGGSDYWNWRNDQLDKLATYTKGLPGETIVIGDLNMTQGSHYFRKFENDSGLRDGSKGFGMTITWPAFFPPLGKQIDHCLISPGIGVKDWRKGSSIGSDHYPIIVDLGMAVTE